MQDASMCGAAGGAHPLVVPVEKLGPLLLLLPRLPVLVLCHLLSLLLIPPLLVEPADLLHRLVGLSYCSNVPLLAAWLGGCVKMGMGTCSLCAGAAHLLGWKRRMPCLRCAGLLSTRWKLSSCKGRHPTHTTAPPRCRAGVQQKLSISATVGSWSVHLRCRRN